MPRRRLLPTSTEEAYPVKGKQRLLYRDEAFYVANAIAEDVLKLVDKEDFLSIHDIAFWRVLKALCLRDRKDVRVRRVRDRWQVIVTAAGVELKQWFSTAAAAERFVARHRRDPDTLFVNAVDD